MKRTEPDLVSIKPTEVSLKMTQVKRFILNAFALVSA